MLPTSAEVEPATSWSPVGRRIQLSHQGRPDSLEQMCGTLNVKYNAVIPNMAKVLKCCLAIPVSSVPCERGFSTQNRIKSKFRTIMANSILTVLMLLKESGPDRKDFDFKKALSVWKNEKKRKLYQHWNEPDYILLNMLVCRRHKCWNKLEFSWRALSCFFVYPSVGGVLHVYSKFVSFTFMNSSFNDTCMCWS